MSSPRNFAPEREREREREREGGGGGGENGDKRGE